LKPQRSLLIPTIVEIMIYDLIYSNRSIPLQND